MASVTKRGDSYFITVSMGRAADGRQKRETLTWTPTPGMTEKQIERELERQKILFEECCKTGQTANSTIKLDELFKQWNEQHVSVNLAEKTAQEYRKLWARISPAIGHLRVDRLRPAHIGQLYAQLQKDGTNLKTGGKIDCAHVHSLLSSMFGYAVRLGMMTTNPCARVQKPKTHKSPPAVLTREQAAAILSGLYGEPLEFQVMVGILICAGLRKGELHGLKWADIDNSGLLWVQRSVVYIDGKGLIEKSTKTESVHPIRLPAGLLALIDEYREEQRARLTCLGVVFADNGYMFVQDDGKTPRHPDGLPHKFKDYLARIGFDSETIKAVHLHTLRHTFATLLLTSGTDIRTTAGLLGHSQPTLTLNTYGHFLLAQSNAAATVFEGLFEPPKTE